MPGNAYGSPGGSVPGNVTGFPGQGNDPGSLRTFYQKAVPEDLKQVKAMWKAIAAATDNPFRLTLLSAEPKFNVQDPNDNRLYVVFADYLAERYLDKKDRKDELERIIKEKIGKQIEVRFVLAADESIQRAPLAGIPVEDRLKEFIHTEIEIEDD